jgi:hypothetical protein
VVWDKVKSDYSPYSCIGRLDPLGSVYGFGEAVMSPSNIKAAKCLDINSGIQTTFGA